MPRRGSARQLQCGDVEMDLVERTVRRAGSPVDLPPTEFELLEDVWSSRYDARSNVVDVQIGNLRRKLDPSGERRYIINVRGFGFRLKGNP